LFDPGQNHEIQYLGTSFGITVSEMEKVDLKKELKELYGAKAKPQLVDVPELKFLMIDGAGDPNGNPAFEAAVQLLYGLSYTIKFELKKSGKGPDYTVMPLEGLWWLTKGKKFEMGQREDWIWTLMIVQPDPVTLEMVNSAKGKLRKKDPSMMVEDCRLESFHEGKSVQMLHIGPYKTEPETVQVMHAFMAEKGLQHRGKHHEIYLSDPRRTDSSKLKTILRYPVD
jgi:hypothetical protein